MSDMVDIEALQNELTQLRGELNTLKRLNPELTRDQPLYDTDAYILMDVKVKNLNEIMFRPNDDEEGELGRKKMYAIYVKHSSPGEVQLRYIYSVNGHLLYNQPMERMMEVLNREKSRGGSATLEILEPYLCKSRRFHEFVVNIIRILFFILLGLIVFWIYSAATKEQQPKTTSYSRRYF